MLRRAERLRSVGIFRYTGPEFGAMRITGEAFRASLRMARPREGIEMRGWVRVKFIDTSDAYGLEVSERLIGEALAPHAAGGVVPETTGGPTRQRLNASRLDQASGH